MNSIWQKKQRQTAHVLTLFDTRFDGLIRRITEDKIRGKPTSGRRAIQMLRDLAKDDGYVTFKRAAVDRGGWTYIASMSETCFIAEKYNTDD